MGTQSKPGAETDEFSDKRILVTGGTKGAGKAIADRFLRGGGAVIITARSSPEEETGSHFIQADVSTSEGTSKVIREILDHFGGLWQQSDNVPFEQSRNVLLTTPSLGDAGRTTTHDASR
jgi:NAD(P)-dependent dehydrogenase (short-subunit alcohol dehydrogenase family)